MLPLFTRDGAGGYCCLSPGPTQDGRPFAGARGANKPSGAAEGRPARLFPAALPHGRRRPRLRSQWRVDRGAADLGAVSQHQGPQRRPVQIVEHGDNPLARQIQDRRPGLPLQQGARIAPPSAEQWEGLPRRILQAMMRGARISGRIRPEGICVNRPDGRAYFSSRPTTSDCLEIRYHNGDYASLTRHGRRATNTTSSKVGAVTHIPYPRWPSTA